MNEWLKQNVPNIEARDYQIGAWDKLRDCRKKGRKRVLVHFATGLGKTSVAAIDVLRYTTDEKPKGRVLFVSHMNDISQQAKNTFLFVNPNFTTTTFKGKLKDVQVTFATFQGLIRQLDNIPYDYFSYIIWDEAHHIEADTFSLVRKHFTPEFELALTATPERADGRDIFNYFGHPIFTKSLADGINEGWLSAVDYHIVFDEAIKEAMDNEFEVSSLKQIRELFAIKSRNEIISKEVKERRHQIGLDKAKTIVFCQNIIAASEMATLLDGEVYHSGIVFDRREDIMRRFKNGKLQVICTVDMFNEGIDIPDARLVVFLRSTSPRTIFEQQLGRGLRRAPGKNRVTVLDFVANVERINFVRELGRHVGGSHSSGTGLSRGSGFDDLLQEVQDNDNFSLSTFDFEDKVVELMDRYDTIKGIEHLTKEEVVERYNDLDKSIQRTADSFGVSWNAIKKHLVKANINTSRHLAAGKSLVESEVVDKYRELSSLKKVADHFGVGNYIIKNVLVRAGETILTHNVPVFATPELIEAFKKYGSVRQAAVAVGQGRYSARQHLINSGFNTSKQPSDSLISREDTKRYYESTNGDILKMAQVIKDETGKLSWVTLYKALDIYGYIQRPVTSAVAAAAYYKFGNSTKAGKYLGVSGSLISRKSKGACYIRKYKQLA